VLEYDALPGCHNKFNVAGQHVCKKTLTTVSTTRGSAPEPLWPDAMETPMERTATRPRAGDQQRDIIIVEVFKILLQSLDGCPYDRRPADGRVRLCDCVMGFSTIVRTGWSLSKLRISARRLSARHQLFHGHFNDELKAVTVKSTPSASGKLPHSDSIVDHTV
jgi:hypothetical protein